MSHRYYLDRQKCFKRQIPICDDILESLIFKFLVLHGVPSNLLNIFSTKNKFSLMSQTSLCAMVNVGVVQGYVLGPLLFAAYINNFQNTQNISKWITINKVLQNIIQRSCHGKISEWKVTFTWKTKKERKKNSTSNNFQQELCIICNIPKTPWDYYRLSSNFWVKQTKFSVFYTSYIIYYLDKL